MSTLTTYELNEQIAKRASEKEEFRVELLSDPKKALENEFGVVIPEGLQIEIHLESKNTLHLIVPERDTLELSDDQLDQVAGGLSISGDISCVYGSPGSWKFNIRVDPEVMPHLPGPGVIPTRPEIIPPRPAVTPPSPNVIPKPPKLF